jgi:pseudoazurin
MMRWGAVPALVLIAGLAGPVAAKEVEVKALNGAPGGVFVFVPDLVRLAPGDMIHFIAADKGHEVHSVAGMIPDGAQPFESAMSQDLTVTLTVPGVYVVACKPHMALGMVALVVVGDAVNLDKLDPSALPGKAKAKLTALLEALRKG